MKHISFYLRLVVARMTRRKVTKEQKECERIRRKTREQWLSDYEEASDGKRMP